MRVSEQQRVDILRYHFVEKWRVGTIATQLGIHHSSVERIISQACSATINLSGQTTTILTG